MPRYYCDYCDTYLTHDSPSVRKQHNAGYKHKANVRSYYQQFEEQQTQSLIDQRIKEHLGQTAAFQQVGAAYNQHLMAQRPRLAILQPTPVPLPGGAQLNPALVPGMRPLPRPVSGPPGYLSAPGMPPMMAPPGAPAVPGQINGLPRPPPVLNLTAVAGSAAPPAPSTGAGAMVNPSPYQANSSVPTSGGFDSFSASAQAPDANH